MKLIPSLALLTAAAASSPGAGAGSGAYYRGGYPQHYDPNNSYQGYSQQQDKAQVQQVAQPQARYAQVEDNNAQPESDDWRLPEPWQEHMDPSSGRAYYYNPESGVTQWERPEGERAKKGSVSEDKEGEIQNTVGQEGVNVGDENNATSGDVNMDPFSNAFAQASGQKEETTGEGQGTMQTDTVEQTAQDGQNQRGFGMDGMQRSNEYNQQYGSQDMQNQQFGQQGQGWTQQHGHSGQVYNWGQQSTQHAELEKKIEQHAGNEVQADQRWRQQQGVPQQGQSTWEQQNEQQKGQSETEMKPEQPAPTEAHEREQMPPQQRGPSGWNQQPNAQVSNWNQQQPGQQMEKTVQRAPVQHNTQQQSGPPPGWQHGRPAQIPPQQQQQQQQPPQSHHPHGPPQWQRQQSPPQQGQPQQSPPGYPMRPGYGMPPPHMQQQHPMYQPQQQGMQRGPPPGYNGYPQYPYGGPPQGMNGPGAGQLVSQRTEELSSAVREKWGQALAGLGSFGNRTKELAESAKNQIGESASNAGKAIGETSTGIWGRLRAGVDNVKGSIFERNADNNQGGGYALSQFGVPPPASAQGHGQQRGGPPPPGYGGRPGYPPNYPPNSGYPGQRGQGFVPRPGYSPPYPHTGSPSQQIPPMQSQWGMRGPGPQGQTQTPMQQGRPPYPNQYPPQGQGPPNPHGQQQQQQQQ
ncbi:hypothetical protein ACHAXN_009209, partial [Cyclotella atomus]